MKNEYYEKLKDKMDEYAHMVYAVSSSFPKHEVYGITSQIRRASLSVVLNYIEGYSRFRKKVMINFLETSYGSLQESKYLLGFCFKENLIIENEYQKMLKLADEIGAMLWTSLKNLSK